MSTLADNIRLRLRALGMSQKDLAEEAGISTVMVHKLVSGKTRETAKLIALARALRCSPDWLLTGAGVPTQDTPHPPRPTGDNASLLNTATLRADVQSLVEEIVTQSRAGALDAAQVQLLRDSVAQLTRAGKRHRGATNQQLRDALRNDSDPQP